MDYFWKSLAELKKKLCQLLSDRYPGQVTELDVLLEGDTLLLKGEVASESCRGDAKRIALAFEGVLKVHNLLEVAAFLEPASDSSYEDDFFGFDSQEKNARPANDEPIVPEIMRRDTKWPSTHSPETEKRLNVARGMESHSADYVSVGSSPAPASVEITRCPTINSIGEIAPGKTFDLVIGLEKQPQSDEKLISLGRFPSNWSVIEISVQVVADWLQSVESKLSSIVLTPNQPAQPARFTCVVSNDYVPGSSAVVMIYFLHGTRVCGHVTRDLVIVDTTTTPSSGPYGSEETVLPATRLGPSTRPASMIKVVPDAVGPTLSVMISRIDDDHQHWTWKAFGPGGATAGSQPVSLGKSPKAFAESLLASCPDLPREEFRRRMGGIGELIWRAAPEKFRQCYAQSRSQLGKGFPIQFLTDDPFVPWEMMKPDIEEGRIDHLYIEHPVARWPLNGAGQHRSAFRAGAILSFVPDYPTQPLKAAAEESTWICSNLGATKMLPKRKAFLDVLDGFHGEPVRMIHFAGHGRADTGTNDGGIELQDGLVGIFDVYQSSVRIGSTDGPLVVLNACESSAGAEFLGINTGWGAAIAARNFGGLIAPLWAVQDSVAFTMTKDSLPQLVAGSATLGAALTAARAKNADEAVAAFAYLAHGDVMARFFTS